MLPEYLAVMSRSVRRQEYQQIFVPSEHFLILERAPKIAGGKSGECSIFVMDFLGRNLRTLNSSCAGAVSWWRIHLSVQSSGLFLRTDTRTHTHKPIYILPMIITHPQTYLHSSNDHNTPTNLSQDYFKISYSLPQVITL
jgi:hypothetical protein